MKPLTISVVLCFRNDAPEAIRTLHSLENQHLQPQEIIIVDDGSDSLNHALIAEHTKTNSKVILLRSASHIGLTRCLCWGCEIASGNLIARIDSGDTAHPLRLYLQESVLSKFPFIACVGSWVSVNNTVVKYPRIVKGFMLAWGGNTIAHPAATFRASAYRKANGYSTQLQYAQDMDLWKRLLPIGAIVNIPVPLTTRLSSPFSISITKRLSQLDCVELSSRKLYRCRKSTILFHSTCLISCAIRRIARIITTRIAK